MSGRRLTFVAIALVTVWWLRRGEDAPPRDDRPQAAVSDGGFLVTTGGRGTRHVTQLDRTGARVHDFEFRLDHDARVVGTRQTLVGWHQGKQVHVATLDAHGDIGESQRWGRSAQRLCEGAASNEYRFGIGWLEGNGSVWFVHGPLGRIAGAAPAVAARRREAAGKAEWCGIASAGTNIALLWREREKLYMNFCTRKECTRLVVLVPLDVKDTLLGYGCLLDSCAFAARDKHGHVKLRYVDARGRVTARVLESATSTTAVSVVGAGRDGFAIAYAANDGALTVQRFSIDGTLANVWRDPETAEVPSLAWAGGKLLVARAHAVSVVVPMRD